MDRRSFLVGAGVGVANLLLPVSGPLRAVAGPFESVSVGDFPIPPDKRLDPHWVQALFERGTPTTYCSTAGELSTIGMPIGGICTGQLYLGGDGKLWLWDIFNLPPPVEFRSSSGTHYAKPAVPASPLEQGFAIRVTAGDIVRTRALDASGFKDITFRGQYPLGLVDYRDEDLPVTVSLAAFSPFIPLNEDDSGLPATLMQYTVRNVGSMEIEVELAGWLENAVCMGSGKEGRGLRRNRVVRGDDWREMGMLVCSAEPPPAKTETPPARQDLPFDDFETPSYDGWTATGTAFGGAPRRVGDVAAYQGDVNAHGERLVNTHETRNGEDVRAGDAHIGTLTSREFTIERDFISFRIGGGNHTGQTCLNLLIEGAPVRTATGRNSNRMRLDHFDVKEFAGRRARLQIVDAIRGEWGNIGVDEIIFTDAPAGEPFVLEQQPDFGTMVLALLGGEAGGAVFSAFVAGESPALPDRAFARFPGPEAESCTQPFPQKPVGSVVAQARLRPGQSATFTFVIAWHFAGLLWDTLAFIPDVRERSRHYGVRFKDAAEVVRYVSNHLSRLATETRLWHQAWYDSTLPYWLLDRTFVNNSTLATATCLRFDNGRFYGWEGTYCCPGTCEHVWQYAQGPARLFPALERWLRENIDFGLAFHDDTGAIDYRAEADRRVAHDGMAGTIVRAYREHQMSPDDAFLKRCYPRIKKAIEYLIREDGNDDGILEGAQYNTLDTVWYGPMAWISSLFLAAVRAGEAMAREMGDGAFADRCRSIAERGARNLVDQLFNGEYFVHRPDPAHPEANSTGDGCHIDQVFGQSLVHQVGLDRIIPVEPSRSALRSLWKYNFAPDIGPYRRMMDAQIKGGRWYAMPGEGGLLMCTWPKGGHEAAAGKGGDAWAAGYFNECMTGFEYQVAGHMIWEGLVMEGLAVTRMIHDRYHATRRNPFNEIECSDHYARAMASYGVFIAACGFEYHGPRGHLAFAPRVTPEDFRAAFTAAEGWGTITQKRFEPRAPASGKAESGAPTERQLNTIEVKWGRLRLRTLEFALAPGVDPAEVNVVGAGREIAATHEIRDGRVRVTLAADTVLAAGEILEAAIRWPALDAGRR